MKREQMGLACWGLRELSLTEQLDMAVKLGVGHLELSIANAPRDVALDADGEETARICKLYKSRGIPLLYAATGSDFTLPEPCQVEEQGKRLAKILALCQKLGVRWLRIFAGFMPAEDVDEACFVQLLACLKEAARCADTCGVGLAVELHGAVVDKGQGIAHLHSVSTRRDCVARLAQELPESVGFVMDPGNLWAVGETKPWEYWEFLKGRVAYMHLKDFVPLQGGGLRPAACGEGGVNWKRVLDAAGDFEGALLMEYEVPQDVERGMRDSLRYIQALQ